MLQWTTTGSMCTGACVCIQSHVYRCMCACVYIQSYVYRCMCVCTVTCVRVHVCSYTKYVYRCMCVCTYSHMCTGAVCAYIQSCGLLTVIYMTQLTSFIWPIFLNPHHWIVYVHIDLFYEEQMWADQPGHTACMHACLWINLNFVQVRTIFSFLRAQCPPSCTHSALPPARSVFFPAQYHLQYIYLHTTPQTHGTPFLHSHIYIFYTCLFSLLVQ